MNTTTARVLHAPARLLAPAALAAALGLASFGAPAPAQAQDSLERVLVDIADVIFRGGDPYYRHDRNDRLRVERDRYGRPVYYRYVPRQRANVPRGVAHGYWRNGPGARNVPVSYRYDRRDNVKCDRKGKCKVEYYDPRYDRNARRRGW